ncbi:MAG TPA: asparagine--tRNA ligase [Gemmatimonadales bacterium]|jgi:asparaginyl-tRNA synthetase
MTAFAYIEDLPACIGKDVTVRGWVMTTRSSGKIAFVVVRDGTGYVQCVLGRQDASTEVWERARSLTQETSVAVTGTVRDDPRSPGGVELGVTGLDVVGPSDEFPITPKEHGTGFLFAHRHLWLRSRRQVAVMRVRHEVIQSIRDFLYERRFVLVDTPILTGSIGESAGTLFSTEYFDFGAAYLAQTGQLYLEAAAAALGRVYCFGPTFRAEKSKTRRHLAEFWMIEPEMAWFDSDDNMRLQETLIAYVVERCLDRRAEDLKELERDTKLLERVTPPFDRLTYGDAIEFLRGRGKDVKWGSDLGADEETEIAASHDRPVFVYNYPKAVRAFYMKEHPEHPELVLNNDLLAPEGYGEIIGGSQREDDYDRLVRRIRENDLPEDAYEWYLDLRRYGTFTHSGFGLGVERTVAWVCGLSHIREAIAFPRMMTKLYP